MASNVTEDPFEELHEAEFFVESVGQNAIYACGIVFNCLTLAALRSLSVGENYRTCLRALTVTDLCACIAAVINLTLEGAYFRGHMPFGYWHTPALFVYFAYYVFMLFMATSSFYVITIAVVRTHTLRQPLKAIRVYTRHRLRRVCFIIFVVNCFLFLPTVLYGFWQNCYNDREAPTCSAFYDRFPNADELKYYFYLMSVMFGPVVIVTNAMCLFLLRRALRKNQESASTTLNRRPVSVHKMARRNWRMTRTLAVLLVLDIIWILPTCIQFLGLAVSPEDTLFNSHDVGIKVFDLFAELLLAVRPTYNIFVYAATNSCFRRKLRLLLCRCCVTCVAGATEGTNDLSMSQRPISVTTTSRTLECPH